ncbi:MAG: ECF-type sigma factor [Planctomycetota bacterium]|jgi:DNA-directed RNA polymerase specialized sigma24 family protein
MSRSDASISHWIAEIKRGNDEAAQAIWDRYFPELVRLARGRLAGQCTRLADQEDVALSVLDSFFRAAARGRFPNLRDLDGLWRLLSRMTHRKAVDRIRYAQRPKRKAVGESALLKPGSQPDQPAFSQLSDGQLGPAVAIMLSENCQRLLNCLTPDLQTLALRACLKRGLSPTSTFAAV